MSKTLVEELGGRYVRDNFAASMFELDGQIMRFDDIQDNQAICQVLNLSGSVPKWVIKNQPLTILKDFSTFRYPKLGYRQFHQGKLGRIVVNLTALRNTQRGLKDDLIHVAPLPVLDMFNETGMFQGYASINSARRAKEIFRPEFTPFYTGIKELLDGKSLAFAVSEDLAVGLSCNTSPDRGFDVYFRGRVVGNVDERGTVNIVNKILQRDSIKRKLFK